MLVFVCLFDKCEQQFHTFLGRYEDLITNHTCVSELWAKERGPFPPTALVTGCPGEGKFAVQNQEHRKQARVTWEEVTGPPRALPAC